MLWLKRNLLLAVGGLLALIMLGGGGYYLWTNHQANSKVDADLQTKRAELEGFYTKTDKPFPNDTNIASAKTELAKVRDVIQQAKLWFRPIVPPAGANGATLAPQEFRILLENALYELRRSAEQKGIVLPGRNYAFSFEAQRKGLTFGPGTFPTMPQQLAEVYNLCSLLFDAQINRLVTIRRTRISADDEANKGTADYHDLTIQTNAVTKCITTPYMFEFQCFSGELAGIVNGLQTSTNGFLLKSLLVEPASAVADASATGAPTVAAAPPPAPVGPGATRPAPGGRPAAPPPDPIGKTVLDERQLKISMMVEVIKCP
jgi:hypothetical protein